MRASTHWVGPILQSHLDCLRPVDNDNPMRQVVVNTHSPLVVSNTSKDDLIYIGSVQVKHSRQGLVVQPFVPRDSWRDQKTHGASRIAPGSLTAYLGLPKDDRHLWFDFNPNEEVIVR